MNFRRRVGWFVVAACVLVTTWALMTRRRPADVGWYGDRVVRIYDVGDLLDVPLTEADSEAQEWRLPPMPPTSLSVPASGLGGPRASRIGGTGSDPTSPERQRLQQLAELLKHGVDPSSWGAGLGSVMGVGRRLVVVQTRSNQQRVAGLLGELRAAPPRHVSVEAVWARLSEAELARFTVAAHDSVSRLIDLRSIQQTASSAVAYRGQAVGVSGQWLRVTCGRSRTVMTEVDSVFDANRAGFVGRAQQLLDGAAVDVRASLSPDGQRVLLDVRSEVNRRIGPDLPPIELPVPLTPGGSSEAGVKLDRLNLGVQSIATSLRGPTGAAIVIGGSTEDGFDDRQLYLVLRVSEASK